MRSGSTGRPVNKAMLSAKNELRSSNFTHDDDALMMLPTALRHRLIEQPMESGEHRRRFSEN